MCILIVFNDFHLYSTPAFLLWNDLQFTEQNSHLHLKDVNILSLRITFYIFE